MYRKLNEEWQINHLIKTGKKIEYVIDTPIGFAELDIHMFRQNKRMNYFK